ncbi:MAG: hypothetical protein DA446_03560 [Bacteroidetes bacterium]|nr:MAG: hypothetical protein DA446_03560 [Bacteroidota bacterium]
MNASQLQIIRKAGYSLLALIFSLTLVISPTQAQDRIKILNEFPAERSAQVDGLEVNERETKIIKKEESMSPGITIPLAANKSSLTVSTFPWTETFEDDSETRGSWTQEYTDGTYDWTFAAGSSGGVISAAYEGSLNARYVSASGGGSTILASPVLDLSTLSNPQLSFWLGQENWFTDINETKVLVRADTTSAWQEIAHYTNSLSSWNEFTVSLPNPSGTYQFGFEGINNWGRANVIDLVTVLEGPQDPVFAGAGSVDFGSTYFGGSYMEDYIINNLGGGDLEVSFTSSSAEVSVSGLPATIAPGESDTLSVTFTPSEVNDAYAGSFELATNDTSNASVTVNVNSEVLDPDPAIYISEDFETTGSFSRPAGWAGNMSVRTSGGVDDSQRLTVNLFGSVTVGQITTPFVNLGDTPEVSFQYRVVDYTGYPANATSANAFDFGVFVSTDYGANYDLVYVSSDAGHTESTDYAEVSADLSAYAGETATVVIQAIRNSGDFYFDLDNIKVGTPPANAVFAGASELDFGVTFLGGSFTSDYVVNNTGGADLTVDLGTASAELVVTGLPATVAPGTSDTLSVTFTPAVIDTVDYAGSFELTTNDPNNASVSVAVSSEVRDPNPSDYIDEDFESTTSFSRPAGWAGNMSVRTSGGVNFSQRLTVNLYGSITVGQIATPFVNLGDTPEVSFQYRVVDYTGYPGNATSAAAFDFGVFVSTDYGANYDLVYLSSDAGHTESTDYAEVSVDLSAYAGETALVIIQSVQNSGDFYFDLDNIKVGTPPSYPIFAADDSIEYGTTYTNETYPVTFVYSNPGGADLEVALESASPELTISGLPSTVAPGTTDSLTVTFAPSVAELFEGSFILTTNDTASDTVTISVTADVQAPPPVASISPESISETLDVNASTTVDLTLSNNGSGQDLTYMVSGYGFVDSTASTMSIGSTVERDLQEEYERSVIADWQNGSLRDLSEEQQQIVSDYQNMIASESSNPAPGLQNAPSVTIEFTDFQASGANIVQVATSGTYNGSIESVTADFVLNSATGGTWADDFMILLIEGDTLAVDGSNFVAQIGGFSTFSAVKYGWGTGGSGTAGTPVATTIDIDPAIAAENLSVWIGNGYASGGTTSWTGSVSLNGIYEQPSFVTDVSPANGSIAASTSETITVTLDATGLVSGQFTEMLYISTNDPEAGFLGVPITLDVIGITPEIAVEDTVMFPTVYTGDTASASVIINSTGDADLEITNITFDNGQFSADSTNYVIQGGQSAIVNLSFASSEAGTVSGTMTIESNAVSGSATVYLEAMAVNPPVAAVDPTSITVEARSGDEGVTSTLTITNDGESDLQFALGATYDSQPSAANAGSGKYSSFIYEKNGAQSVVSTKSLDSTELSAMKAFGDGNVSFEAGEGFEPGFIQGQNGWGTFFGNVSQPAISPAYASDGDWSLELANEPTLSSGSLVGAFSPQFYADQDVMSYSVDTFMEATGGADYDVIVQSPTQGLLTVRVKFNWEGNIFILDDSSAPLGFVDTEVSFATGEWKNLTITINQTEGSIDYSYDGTLIYTGNLFGATIAEQAIFLHDNWNAGEAGYIDNFQFDAVREWLSADMTSGTISAGDSMEIELGYNTAVEVGEYAATLLVATNDPSAELIQIPISYTLNEALNVDYSLTLTMSDTQPNVFDLELGTSPDATIGYDPDFDQLAPPAPPDGAFDVRLIVDGTSYFKAYQPTTVTETMWRVEFAPRAGYEPMTISWDPAELPASGSFMLTDVADGSFYNVDMRSTSSITVTEDFITALTLTHKLGQDVSASYIDGWNMVSLPVEQAHDSYLDLMPDAEAGTLFGFDSGYQSETTMTVGAGYWVNMTADNDVTFNGEEVSSLTLDVAADWNMIGSLSEEAAIVDDSEIVEATWAYNNGYFIPDSYMPGSAYWLAASAAGSVDLIYASDAGSRPASSTRGIETELFHNVSVMSGEGEVDLYFAGSLGEEVSDLQIAMPPVPPAGLFDARIAGDRWISADDVIAVQVQHGEEPVTVSVNGDEIYELVIYSGKDEVRRQELSAGESVEIPASSDNFTIGLYDASAIPDVFSLDQNYPNPFNPSTTIRFGVPEVSDVKLEVFNMLGQKVATLVNESKDAGFYNVAFDASSLSSGMYIYRLQSGSFVETRKLMLIK